MTKEEILTQALNNRCKYESSKEMDYDAHLAIMDAMGAYAYEQTEKYKELIKAYKELCTYLTNYDALTPKGINSLVQLNAKIEQLKTELGL